jgi:hypothetical protein
VSDNIITNDTATTIDTTTTNNIHVTINIINTGPVMSASQEERFTKKFIEETEKIKWSKDPTENTQHVLNCIHHACGMS